MNECFLIGKIASDIEFKFILNSRKISMTRFKLKVSEKCIVIVKAYDEMADWCCQKLISGDTVAIEGKIDNQMEIIVNTINLVN